MKYLRFYFLCTATIILVFFIACKKKKIEKRSDGASLIKIDHKGSLQNPAWSPDNNTILLTNFLNGYNTDPADILLYTISSGTVRKFISNNYANVNLPGSSWNAVTHEIVFSSSREPHDEIYAVNADNGSEIKVTERDDKMAFEPSLSPDGKWVVFESHKLDEEGNGIITKFKMDGSSNYIELTDPAGDCRQPNWSPAGDLILYQKQTDGQWDIWTMDTLGNNKRPITNGKGDKTDASFSPDGKYIVYSSNESDEKYANLYIISVISGNSIRVTNYTAYDGAPSWSNDGRKIIFESSFTEPETPTLWTPADPHGTKIWIIDSPI